MKKGIPHMILKIVLILAIFGVAVFGALIGYVCIREAGIQKDPGKIEADYDAVIVLGAEVKPDGEPSVQLAWRLDAAADVYRRKQVPVVVCGAQGKNEPRPEAEVMAAYLEEKGIPKEMILLDSESFNTDQNIANARRLLSEQPGEIRKVIVVTSDYHVPRALALAEDYGLSATGIGSPCKPEYWFKNHSRESLAWVKYWLNKFLGLKL